MIDKSFFSKIKDENSGDYFYRLIGSNICFYASHNPVSLVFSKKINFIKSLYDNFGDYIYDKRYKSFCAFTSRKLKQKFQNIFEDYISKNSEIDNIKLYEAIKQYKEKELKNLSRAYKSMEDIEINKVSTEKILLKFKYLFLN